MNRYIKKYNSRLLILLPFVFTFFSFSAEGQQQPLYSQYDNNKYLFNPAVAGADVVTTIHLNAYEQWVGFKDAPKYHTASVDGKIFNKDRRPRRNIRKKFKFKLPENVGLGAQIFNEKYGPLSQSGFIGTYAYHLRMGENQLSFGLSTSISNYGINTSDVVFSDEQPDQLVDGDNSRRWISDFDFGIFFSGESYFAGYSVHHISESALQWGGTVDANYKLGRIHYLMGGYSYDISEELTLQPTTLIKLAEKQKSQIDFNLKLIISKMYWAGLSFKSSKIGSVFAGIKINRFIFGYSFDYSISPISKYSYGSHEINLAVRLGNETSRYKWLNTY